MPQGPLAGVRIVDLSIAAAGPYATAILASQGADVVKVERPDGGDFMRHAGATWKGVSALFAGWNRGKESICIDLQKPEGADIVRRLVREADVFVHNLRPGNAEKMGLGYEDLRAVKRDIIYVILTGWGERGPLAGAPAYDTVMQAVCGFASNQGGGDSHEPRFIQNAICDKTTGLILSQLITSALYSRRSTGEGQRVHVSMLQAALAFLWPDGMQAATFLDAEPGKAVAAKPPPLHRTADGWISISLHTDKEHQSLCRVLALEELAQDARFAKGKDRYRNFPALWAIVAPVLARRTTAELARRFAENRVPFAVVNSPERVHEDPQVAAIEALEIQSHPTAGRTRLPRPVGDFSVTPLATPSPAPDLGQQTDLVLRRLGFSDDDISRLRASGAVA